jgi:catechol 2,3-dioxygenase-like lactoylglutathione lyase family enzyme
MATNYPINPRVRAYGKARLDIAGRARNQAQWEKLWKHPANSFPFVWGESWKQCIEYKVDDFPAEVGFFIDILGLPINALDPGYAMFTSPQGDFFLSVVPSLRNEPSTPPDAFRLQFMVKDIIATTNELQHRGIDFNQTPQPLHPGSTLCIASFRTPHGISVELWGKVEIVSSSNLNENLLKDKENEDEMEDKDEFEEDGDSDNSDEDESDEDDDNSDLITKQNGDEDEGELEGEGLDDDKDDYDFDEDKDEFDPDEDDEDDELDGDEDAIQLKSHPQKSAASNSSNLPIQGKSNPSNRIIGNLIQSGPEYIDLDVT